MKNSMKIFLIIVCLFVIVLVMGGSYAYFSSYAVSEQQVIKFGTLEITYETGQDILVENAVPINDESEASSHKFTIRNTKDEAIDYNISFVDISLQKDGIDVFSNNLMWRLYKTDSTYQQLELVKQGTFSSPSGFLSGDKELVIKTDLHLEAGESQSYCLKIGLFNSTSLQNEDAGMDLSFKIQVDSYDRVEAVSKQSLFNTVPFGTSDFQKFYKLLVTKVVYQDRIEPLSDALYTLDASLSQDGSCMAYLVENQEEAGTYTIYIQGNDEIFLPESCAYMFDGMVLLREIENIQVLNTSQVKDMTRMFSGCSELISLDLSSFDTSNVMSMEEMFADCTKLTDLDISRFNTSQVVNMGWMFKNTGITALDLSNFDTSNVALMNGMFYNCQKLRWLDLSSFNTPQLTRLESFLEGCSSLVNLDISNFDLSKVTNLSKMFKNCSSLARLNLDNLVFLEGVGAIEVFAGLYPNIYIIVEDTITQETLISLLNGFGITTATVVVAD